MGERDFLVNDEGAMVIRNGTFAVGSSLTQEVALILLTDQGEIRHDVFCGCNLVRYMNRRITRSQLERIVRIQLERDGKRWSDIKNGVNLFTNG